MPIIQAKLQYAADGCTLFSAQFDDVYHSAAGAQAQAEAVFLQGNQLPQRWQRQRHFTIIETGFGQGINFLTTWKAWREDPHRCTKLHFISVEQHPFTREDLAQLLRNHADFTDQAQSLLAQWPELTPGFHRLYLDNGQVVLSLLFGEVLEMLHEVVAKVDAIYLDGFSPSKNPDMWRLPVFKALWRLCKADTTLASYTVAGQVRRGLTEAGFCVEKKNGFASKRQMLVGQCARLPRPPRVVGTNQPAASTERSAIIIGAGIAGCAMAASLAERGWAVRIFEADAAIAQHASGNHVGLCHPTFSKDDNALARLSRLGFSFTQQRLVQLATANYSVHFGMDGHFQGAKDAENECLLRDTAQHLNFPASLVQYLSSAEASHRLGTPVSYGGWWFDKGIWLNPASLCKAYLSKGSSHIKLELNTPIHSIQYTDDRWHLFAQNQQVIASTSTLILANACTANQLIAQYDLPLSASWRVVTQVPAAHFAPELPSNSGTAYLTPEWKGYRSLGAKPLVDGQIALATAANLAELQTLLPNTPEVDFSQTYSRACARPNTLDRLPLIGQLHTQLNDPQLRSSIHQLFQMPRQAGLYTVLGFGSRGITWHALAAEIIACQLENEPLPLERSLLNAVDPARFELRNLRKTPRL